MINLTIIFPSMVNNFKKNGFIIIANKKENTKVANFH